MSAWIILLLMFGFLVVSILVNLYLTSRILDGWHETLVKPIADDVVTLQLWKEQISER